MQTLSPFQRAGGAYATAGLWGETGNPTAAELDGFGYVSFPVGPTSDLEAYVAAVHAAKSLGKRVHVVVHHDGEPAQFAYWPYAQPGQFIEFNRDLGSRLAPYLDAGDTWEVTNEPSANPSLGDTWAQQLPLFESTLPKARDAVRAAGVKAMMVAPVPGAQSPTEALNVQVHNELPLAVYKGWDALGGHFYAPSGYTAINPRSAFAFATWADNFQALASATGLPWIASEYGWHDNNSADGPSVLLAMRSILEAYAAVGTCLGGIVWQLRTYDPATSIGNNPQALAACSVGRAGVAA